MFRLFCLRSRSLRPRKLVSGGSRRCDRRRGRSLPRLSDGSGPRQKRRKVFLQLRTAGEIFSWRAAGKAQIAAGCQRGLALRADIVPDLGLSCILLRIGIVYHWDWPSGAARAREASPPACTHPKGHSEQVLEQGYEQTSASRTHCGYTREVHSCSECPLACRIRGRPQARPRSPSLAGLAVSDLGDTRAWLL